MVLACRSSDDIIIASRDLGACMPVRLFHPAGDFADPRPADLRRPAPHLVGRDRVRRPRADRRVQNYMFASLDNFPLLAVPFFVLAGEIMGRRRHRRAGR